jgi:hypothetical protein
MALHDVDQEDVSADLAAAAYELGNMHLEAGNLARAEYWLGVAERYGSEGARDSLDELQELAGTPDSHPCGPTPEVGIPTPRSSSRKSPGPSGATRCDPARRTRNGEEAMTSDSRSRGLLAGARATAATAALGMTGIVVVLVAVATQFATHRTGLFAIGGASVAFLAQLRVIAARPNNSA